MKLEDQVLSIEQVQELQELGFDVKKHASMYFVPNWITKYGINEIQDYLLTIGELGDDYKGDCIPTMSIGDIIDILPHHKFLLEKGYEDTNIYHLEHKFSSLEGIKILQHESGSFLRLLFDNLKWCIINKLIES